MKAFINGTGIISPQLTYDNSCFLDEIQEHNAGVLRCIEPNYKEYIKPIQLRRMGRSLRMGVTAAGICLRDAMVEIPDSIITGTGLGMMEETEKFLISILENGEKFLTPTSFIQSTHNTVGAYIAVMLKCNKYNYTYVHENISFESALLDAMMKADENNDHNILLGGIDEMTEQHLRITNNAGYWNKNPESNLKLFEDGGKGAIPGEGAAFFMLSARKSPSCYAAFKDLHTFYKPANLSSVTENITSFLARNGLKPGNLDLLLSGLSGDPASDVIYNQLQDTIFRDIPAGAYKHLCGEYYTSSSFASWLAANILRRQVIPETVLRENNPPAGQNIRNILIYNQYQNINHSLILLSEC